MTGICTLSNIPLRKEANSRSEIVSTLLFGDTYTVQHRNSEWMHITTISDAYTGYISAKQHTELTLPITHSEVATGYPFSILQTNSGVVMAPFGCALPNLTGETLNINQTTYTLVGKQEAYTHSNIILLAKQFINTPYLWGGKTAFGIDCSGFVQVVFNAVGTQLPRDAYQQAEVGNTVSFLEETLPGDLAFFDNEEGKITHVGIMMNPNQIIHASGNVRIESIDSYGIMNRETQQYSHKLRIIKRINNLTR